jgi:N-acetyl-D-muramate 6-phosphate phosphatase
MTPEGALPPGGNRFRAVLFDLDGTFADTLPDLAAALDGALAEAGRPPVGVERLRPRVAGGTRALLAEALDEAIDADLHDTVRRRFLERYGEAVAVRTRLFPGMEEVVAALEARGTPWGVVTNKRAIFTEPLLAALGYGTRAGCVVSGDTAARPKPHPDPLLLAAARLGCPSAACLYVGDARSDVEAGRAANMGTLVALYGYLPADDHPAGWAADGLIAHPAELLPWVEGH